MGKSRDSHLTLELYLLALKGELALSALLKLGHAHLMERCSECREAWDGEGGDRAVPFGNEPVEDDDENATSRADVERVIERYSLMRRLDREAREDVEHLLRSPSSTWAGKVTRARTRFRTRAFAQRLLAECRERVRDDPSLAGDLAALVPIALRWATENRDWPWAWALVASAEAHRANALRVEGDLAGAAMRFARLRARLKEVSWRCPETFAEIASLYSTLHVEQGRFREADELLQEAGRWYDRAETQDGNVRVLIKRANLAGIAGDRLLSFHLHTEAASRADREHSPYLHLTTVTGRVLALSELGRLEEARSLLERYQPSYEEHAGGYGAALWRCLRGRVALSEERIEEARQLLREGRDALVEFGRNQDAAMASLDLAAVYAKAGDLKALRTLSQELVEVFSSLGVERELLTTLGLLSQAGQTESKRLALIAMLRSKVEARAATR